MGRIVNLTGVQSANDVVSVNTVNTGVLAVMDDGHELGRLTVEHLWLEGQEARFHVVKLSCGDAILYLVRAEDRSQVECIPVDLRPMQNITYAPFALNPTHAEFTITGNVTDIYALDGEYLNILFEIEVQRSNS